MLKRSILLCSGLALVSGLLISCSGGVSDNSTVGALFLDCAEPKLALEIGEITSFHVLFRQETPAPGSLEVSLDTLDGQPWKAGLCYEDQCFIHDGRQKLVREISVDGTKEFEIKFFVPDDAKAGQSKTLRMTASIKGKPSQFAEIQLIGQIP